MTNKFGTISIDASADTARGRKEARGTYPVSVIIPLFNKAAYIERTLRSVSGQTFRDFEALVVDDGSTDDSAAIVQRYIAETGDNRFRLIRQQNQGPGAARNRGAKESSAPLLAFLDADDEWTSGYLQHSLSTLELHGKSAAAVTSAYHLFPDDISSVPLWQARGLETGLFRIDAQTPVHVLAHALAFMSPWSTVMRKSAFERYGGYYEKRCMYGEDSWLFLKILLNETVALNMEPLAIYHTEASELAHGKVRRTPLEPILADPAPMDAACPDELKPLLHRFLTFRALKRSCVLGYWGATGEARELTRRFNSSQAWRMKYYIPAKLAGTGLLSPIGAFMRALQRF